jgi:hypothetical protein
VIVHFPEPDSAYLVVAALRQELRVAAVAGVYVVPTDSGPALECADSAWGDELVQDLVAAFQGSAADEI